MKLGCKSLEFLSNGVCDNNVILNNANLMEEIVLTETVNLKLIIVTKIVLMKN